jgi:hypothetical protein
MRIVVNHLTRMGAGYICVAGVDPETRAHVRPVVGEGPLPFDLLARYGGPFDIARVVDLGNARPRPQKPHVEDHVIVPSRPKSQGLFAARRFWELLQEISKTSLRAIFGESLIDVGRGSWAVPPGKGGISLGCFGPTQGAQLQYVAQGRSGKPEVRVTFHGGEGQVNAGVTDIRFYADDHLTPRRDLVERAARRLQQPGAVILGVGLTRPFASRPQDDPRCWLQVTGIHLEENPAWELG